MAQSVTSPTDQPGVGDNFLYRKLDELSSMMMRTREDGVETKVIVKAMAEGQARHEKRMEAFEKDVDNRFIAAATETNRQIEAVATEVKTIREERIAEKAHWRGPEKVIAAIVSIAGLLGAIVAIKTFVFP